MEKTRRYDLDWLRVIVFGLLIFYHVGMFFVPWGWHIKNNQIYDWLTWPMLFLNQWRLPILFVISGMGTAYALSFRTPGQFMKERFVRLFIPLAFGMLFIVSPQVYIERIVDGDFVGSYLSWYMSGAFVDGIYPEGNFSWNHLWFLPYLLAFSVILTPVFVHLRKNKQGRFLSWLRRNVKRNPFFLFWFIVPLYFYEALLEPFFPVQQNLVNDWFNFTRSLTLFFYGFVLISIQEEFWEAVQKIWKKTLIVGLICFPAVLIRWYLIEDSLLMHFLEAWFMVGNIWAWILTIFGIAATYLNKPSKELAYANRAVYPFYILHQTITIALGYFIYDQSWSFLPKFMLLLIGTFGFSFLIYEFLIQRVQWLWVLFGVKGQK